LIKKISNKDKKDWQNFLNSKEKLLDKDQSLLNKNVLGGERSIDLHGYSLESANEEAEKFILKCFNDGITKANIITGKGTRSKNINDPYQSKDLSILKYSVPNYIRENKNLMDKIIEIDQEAVESPNKGNFNIFLRKKID
tara:strand:- start:64 stop:483 length:420 start_codon:yes stop_codon:yes gene_type:complete